MNKNNNINYVTISNKENGYGGQYRICKKNNNYEIKQLIFINSLPIWQNISIDSETKLNTIYDAINYICKNIEHKQENIKTRKKVLKK